LTTDQIVALTTDQAGALTSVQVASLGTAQVNAFETRDLAQFVSNDIGAFTSSQITALSTYQVSALTTEFASFITSDDIIGLSTVQMAALVTAQVASLSSVQTLALTSVQVAAFETNDLAALTTANVAVGLTSVQIAALTTDQIVGLTTDQAFALTSVQIQALGTAQVFAFETRDLAQFTSVDVGSLLSSQIVALSATQISSLTTNQFDAWTSGQLGYIQTQDLSSLTTAQVSTLTSVEVMAIGSTQISGIATSAQIETLLTTQLAAFKSASITSAQFGALYVTPIVLDLNGDGIQTTSMQDGVSFDINNDGKVDQTAWVARGDGLLVRDINKDGQINNGSELFGSATSLGNGKTAADGYAAMKALDTNNDGVLDASDAAFGELSVWTDNNGNGMTDGNELTKLSDLGINSLSLNATKSSVNNNGNLIGLMGSYTTTDGQMHTMGDVWFQTDASGNRVFDLAAIAKAAGISKVDMTNAQADQLNVTLADVLAVGTPDILSGTSQVTITGDSGVVNLTAGGSGWSLAGTQTDGADTYMVYVNQNAHLLINDKIHLIIS
jgi:hypothetical protein